MSKLVSQSFEYALYDDAVVSTDGSARTLTSTPPNYPPAIDSYQSNATATAGTSYGSTTLTVGPVITTLNLPVGATVLCAADSKNTMCVTLIVSNVSLTPNGSPTNLSWPVAPGQTVTFPGVFNPGTVQIASTTAALAGSSSPGTITLMWGV